MVPCKQVFFHTKCFEYIQTHTGYSTYSVFQTTNVVKQTAPILCYYPPRGDESLSAAVCIAIF